MYELIAIQAWDITQSTLHNCDAISAVAKAIIEGFPALCFQPARIGCNLVYFVFNLIGWILCMDYIARLAIDLTGQITWAERAAYFDRMFDQLNWCF